MPEKLLTIDQAADLLNVRREFMSGLLDQGALPSVGHGSERHVVEAIFLAYRDKRNAERHEAIKRMARADVEAGVYDLVILPEGATDE
jgi:excisionase family DNA binding protein